MKQTFLPRLWSLLLLFICMALLIGVTPLLIGQHPAAAAPGADGTLYLPAVMQLVYIPTGTTSRVSVATNGVEGNSWSEYPSISDDGRYIAFRSDASTLVSDDTNGMRDAFVHDRYTGETRRVSLASDGTEGNNTSYQPAISGNGRYVVFSSAASNLVSDDTNDWPDIFVYDLQTGEIERVSVASDGTQANGSSGGFGPPAISDDGRYVAFMSVATNLDGNDPNNIPDVYVHDRQTGETTLASVSSDGTLGSGPSELPAISGNGRYVSFSSLAANLVNNDTNGRRDIFVHDLQTGETTRISVASDGTEGNDEVYRWHSISDDGRYVAFASDATNLVHSDTNGRRDIFVHDRQIGNTMLVSVASDGTQGNDRSQQAVISGNGRYVAFESQATNLVKYDNNGPYMEDIFVRDLQTEKTTMVTLSTDGTQAIGYDVGEPTISDDGRFVAFRSDASNLIGDDMNSTDDIFVRDRDG